MAYFSWSVSTGSLNVAANWSQPDPENPTVPGPNDYAEFQGSGTLLGSADVGQSEIDGSFTLEGILDLVQGIAIGYADAGTLTINDGGSLGTGYLNIGQLSAGNGTLKVLDGSVNAARTALARACQGRGGEAM